MRKALAKFYISDKKNRIAGGREAIRFRLNPIYGERGGVRIPETCFKILGIRN